MISKTWKLGLIGAGNMGSALLQGVVNGRLLPGKRIWIADVDEDKAQALARLVGGRVADTNGEVFKQADTVILAVKPQNFNELLDEIWDRITDQHLVISIAAGIPMSRMTERFGEKARVIRVMPNTPYLVGCGAAGVAPGGGATREDLERALQVFGSAGLAVEVQESQINAVTGLSGSGPAYVFHMIEAMTDAGVKAGLSPEAAAVLTRQTVLGAARMVVETGVDPAELRRRVTSPNGTTEAGLKIMTEGDFMGLITRTIARATERGEELARGT